MLFNIQFEEILFNQVTPLAGAISFAGDATDSGSISTGSSLISLSSS